MNAADLSVYLVTDRSLCLNRDLVRVVAEAVAGGATMVQLREKHCDSREFVELGRALKKLLAPAGAPLIINDRVDVALAVGADGVHVGQSDMHVMDVRRHIGPDRILGLSIESADHARDAENLPVDYYGVGPVFATSTKPDAAAPLGLEGFARIRSVTSRPVVAIGGLDASNSAAAVRAGAQGVSVVSAVCSAESPREATRAIRRAVEQGLGSRLDHNA
jgi:thiamine-phosphate pyrophosphorylase